MGKLSLLFLLVVFHFIDCTTIIDGQNLHSFGAKPQPQTIYVTKQQFPVQETNKQIPVYVSLNPVSSYRVNQQFPERFTNQFSHSVSPYNVNTPNLYLPYNNLRVSSDINTDYSKPVHISLPQVHSGTKVGSVKAPPVYQHQIYHPLHTNTQNVNKEYKELPTPPKIYRNFHPMIPQQIQEHKIEKPAPEEEKEEINEEEEENERLEQEDDHENQQEDEEKEEYFKPTTFFDGKYDSERYRHHDEAEDEDDDRYSSSKVSSKYKYPKEQKRNRNKHVSDFSESDYDNFRGFKVPKVEIKMYKYSKTMKKPERKEYLEEKESRNIPVIQRSQKSYKKQWIISSQSSSTADE